MKTQVSRNRWMDKQNMVYTYSRILFSLKKEGSSETCTNMDEPWRHVKWSKPVIKGQILYDSTYMRYLSTNSWRQKVEWLMLGLRREENGELLFNEYRVSVWEGEKVLEMDGSDGHTTVWMYLMPLNCVLKSDPGTSLGAQWLRIHLPVQGTWVRSLVLEDPTCRGATKPVCHNYWACALEPAHRNYWSPCAC